MKKYLRISIAGAALALLPAAGASARDRAPGADNIISRNETSADDGQKSTIPIIKKNNVNPIVIIHNFDADDENYSALFADYPEGEDEFYELDSGYEALPGGLVGSGVFINGNNHSDDLFMLLWRKIDAADGIAPNTAYGVSARFDIATAAGSGCFGVGGAPGEDVFVMAGVIDYAPQVSAVEQYMTVNFDKGNQATGGEDMSVIGNLANGEGDCSGENWRFKNLQMGVTPVTSNSSAEIWLLLGTDSGYESVSRWYLTQAEITITRLAPSPRRTDFNGDGTSDIGIFRPASGLWAVRGMTRVYFGGSSDRPVPGDYNADGTTEIAIFRPASGLWAIRGMTRAYFGSAADTPLPGNYSGDGTTGIGIFRPASGLWAVRSVTRVYFGSSLDIPVPGDYTGSGTAEIGIFRPASGLWAARGLTRAYFGRADDLPVPADYDSVPGLDPGIFRSTSGLWAVYNGIRHYFGGSGDTPVPADYRGDGIAEVGIFRPSTGLWAVRNHTRIYFGGSNDIPVTR